jgi:hypothetical protein
VWTKIRNVAARWAWPPGNDNRAASAERGGFPFSFTFEQSMIESPFPQTAECGRCGSEPLRDLVVVREGGRRDGAEAPKLLRERDDA